MLGGYEPCMVCGGMAPIGMPHDDDRCIDSIAFGIKDIVIPALPEPKWSMSIGSYTVNQYDNYSIWKAFWLRFMGWKVEKM